MSTSITQSKCTVVVTTPAGSPVYDAANVEVEVTAVDVSAVTVNIYVPGTSATIVQATALAAGSITIENVPLVNASGNNVKVRYYNSPTEAVILGSTGIYVRAYA